MIKENDDKLYTWPVCRRVLFFLTGMCECVACSWEKLNSTETGYHLLNLHQNVMKVIKHSQYNK